MPNLWTERFDRMLDASTCACIVLVQTLLFVASLAFAPRNGIPRRSTGA